MWVRPQCEPPVTSSIAPVIQGALGSQESDSFRHVPHAPVRPSGVPFSIC